MRVFPYFMSLLVIVGLLWLAVFAGAGFKGFPTPKLGLDLQGGMTMTLRASLPNGETPNGDQLEQARQIIENRVNGTGVAEPEVYVEGSNNIVVNVAGKQTNQEEMREIGAPAELRFREVVGTPAQDLSAQNPEEFEEEAAKEGDDSQDAEGQDSETPSDEESASGSDDESAKESEDAKDDESKGEESGDEKSKDEDDAKGEENKESDALKEKREKVLGKIDDEVVKSAEAFVAQKAEQGQPVTMQEAAQSGVMEALAPFGDLSPDDVAVLEPEMQYYIPTIGCGQLNARTPGSISNIDNTVVACNRPSESEVQQAKQSDQPPPYVKYMMAKTNLIGEDVSTAAVQPDQQAPGQWAVGITFTSDGTDKWVSLAKRTVNKNVAIVLDNEVISAPTIEPGAANGGQVSISGDFTTEDANLLADQLKYGALPAAFDVETIDTVSATLGLEQLKAGMIAGGIGLLLVVLYCFAYYRFLGVTVISSLVVSAALTYPMVVMLSQQIGLTLTLAGIAGFIVAVGITADAFVVMFERLKDEIKEGRSARSAVPRAWVRARRTIISANVVNFMSAVVLYILGIGVVKGFAFALGLSTISGMILVFLFTHPLVSVFSRGKIMASPKLSGIHVGMNRPSKQATGKLGTAEAKES
ncbi:MAG TPA: protein translocase subunit SecD [Candidatus Stackebrandtia faecavium]|nr:protein translocase subunit SecD [Candidatus Stackebrandtia faecavium]